MYVTRVWFKIENESLTIKEDTLPEIALLDESGCLADFPKAINVIDKYADFVINYSRSLSK